MHFALERFVLYRRQVRRPPHLEWLPGDNSMCSFISRDLHTFTQTRIFLHEQGDSILTIPQLAFYFIFSFTVLIYTWGWTFSSESLLTIHFFFSELLLHNLSLLFWVVFFLVHINLYSHCRHSSFVIYVAQTCFPTCSFTIYHYMFNYHYITIS